MEHNRKRAGRRWVEIWVGLAVIGFARTAGADAGPPVDPDAPASPRLAALKGQPMEGLLSSGGLLMLLGPGAQVLPQGARSMQSRGSKANVFVNDPCLDPPPPDTMRTVQSETEIAVLNSPWSMGKK